MAQVHQSSCGVDFTSKKRLLLLFSLFASTHFLCFPCVSQGDVFGCLSILKMGKVDKQICVLEHVSELYEGPKLGKEINYLL